MGKNAKTLDFKLGKKTAFKFDKGSFGNVRHIILDSDMSRSKSQGFRLEGATDGKEIVEEAKKNKKISGWFHTTPQDVGKKQTNSALYTLHANFVWNKFIENKEQASSLKQQLNELDDKFVMPNMEAETKNEESIGFIGSSILIVKGDGGIKFKLIDFAHPFWSHPTMSKNQHHKEVVLNYNEGLKMFIEIYNKWYNDKYFDEPPPMPAAAPPVPTAPVSAPPVPTAPVSAPPAPVPPAPVPTAPVPTAPVPTAPVSAPPVPTPVAPPVGGKRRTKKKKRRKRKKRKTKRKRKRK